MADLAAITAKLEALLSVMSQHAQREERLIKRDMEDLARHRREQLQVIKDGVADIARALLAEGRR